MGALHVLAFLFSSVSLSFFPVILLISLFGFGKGVFWKRGLPRKARCLEIPENSEILEIVENLQTLGNKGEFDHFLEFLENLEI